MGDDMSKDVWPEWRGIDARTAPGAYVGFTARKAKGYKWPGVIVADFVNLSGQRRIVIECTVPEVEGALHIYAADQVQVEIQG